MDDLIDTSLHEDMFDPFRASDFVLPGESTDEFDVLVSLYEEELQPTNTVERFWTFDLVHIRWTKQRYEKLKHVVVQLNIGTAIEAILLKIYSLGALEGSEKFNLVSAQKEAKKWRENTGARAAVEAFLAQHGFNDAAIIAEAFLLSAAAIQVLDKLIAAGQRREICLLREIGSRREFARRIRAFDAKSIETPNAVARGGET